MRLNSILAMAWESMTQRKLRTSLTTLGVVIGITAIIGLASLGEGFRMGVKERMEQGFELDVLVILPIGTAGSRGYFTQQEVESIRNITGVKLVAPMITFTNAKLTNNDNETLNSFTVAAVNFSEMTQMIPERLTPLIGEIPTPEDNDTVVLGYKTTFLNETKQLTYVDDNVSLAMQISIPPYPINITRQLRVAAILQRSGASMITNFDYWAFIPMNTTDPSQKEYNIVLIKVLDPENSEQIAKEIESIFENPYSISIIVPLSFMRQVDNILNFVQLFLMAIASISLLVAGIGIMNIMTVSVMERTREIGILKAIGAKNRTVLSMFLAEAMLIGLIGGFVGIFAGYGLSFGLTFMLSGFIQPQQQGATIRTPETQRMNINPVFSPQWTIAAFVFAIVVCIVFGLYPARKAAKLNPVEALRYE